MRSGNHLYIVNMSWCDPSKNHDKSDIIKAELHAIEIEESLNHMGFVYEKSTFDEDCEPSEISFWSIHKKLAFKRHKHILSPFSVDYDPLGLSLPSDEWLLNQNGKGTMYVINEKHNSNFTEYEMSENELKYVSESEEKFKKIFGENTTPTFNVGGWLTENPYQKLKNRSFSYWLLDLQKHTITRVNKISENNNLRCLPIVKSETVFDKFRGVIHGRDFGI